MRSITLVSSLIVSSLLGAACESESIGRFGRDDEMSDAGSADASSSTKEPPQESTQDSSPTPNTSADANSTPGPVARSPLARATTEPSETEEEELAAGMSSFAFDLLQQLRRDSLADENFAFSPTSIALALGMAYAGAAGNTASQMKSVMHIASSNEAYFRSLNWLDQQLESRAETALKRAKDTYASMGNYGTAPDPSDFRFHVVNSFWGERTMTFEQPFLDVLAESFGTGMRLADFRTQPDAERLAINAWVSEETLHRINDLIPEGSIVSATRAVLVNAIHLKLPWADPFLEQNTSSGTFIKSDGSTVSVPLMHGSHEYAYAEDDTQQAVAIPLSGGSIDFVVFLPKATTSLGQFEDSLSQARAAALVTSMKAASVQLSLPKFEFTTPSMMLAKTIRALGMTDAFGAIADFTGITKQESLFISEVVHKAMVGADEHGVEAAAATAVMMTGHGMPTDVKEMNVNRPFFFGIYDEPTSTWLFLGHVLDPSS